MAPRIKYAAVGCGGMGRRHLRGMAALYGSSRCNLELVAACDLKPEQVNLFADEAEQLLGTRPRVFTDIAEMAHQIPDLQAADVTVETASTTPSPSPAWRPACTSWSRSRWALPFEPAT